MVSVPPNRHRVLIADDEQEICDEFALVFNGGARESESHAQAANLEAELFGDTNNPTITPNTESPAYDLTVCRQGLEAVEAVRASIENNKPFSVAFLDVRMPPGISGVEAAEKIRQYDPNINIVIVTAYSDIHPQEITRRVPPADKILFCH